MQARVIVRDEKFYNNSPQVNWNREAVISSINFLWVAMHEFGHVLGLSHITASDSRCPVGSAGKTFEEKNVMAADISSIKLSWSPGPGTQSLGADDKWRIAQLYSDPDIDPPSKDIKVNCPKP